MYDALIVQVHETLEDLRDIDSDEVLWELSKSLANVVQRAILAKSGDSKERVREGGRGVQASVLQDNVQVFWSFHKALVLDNVGVLHTYQNEFSRADKLDTGAYIEVLQQVDLRLQQADGQE